ncbi:MAG: hypothetical protein AMJ46_06710 [Latescibacteria bacterium DG_63]|nr:MAG: hypothetical protein AMJ46_06710 [Latescibacteria bacterium DG_63]
MTVPEFPHFKPIEMEDRPIVHQKLWNYQPQGSEWTFTNLFIWRAHYGLQWCTYHDWLCTLCHSATDGLYAMQPIGPGSRVEVTRTLLQWLRDEKGEREPRIERVDGKLISEIGSEPDLLLASTRDQFDYVYRSEDLIELRGRKYHSKRNHISKFLRSYSFTYAPLNEEHLKSCVELSGIWCERHRCEDDMNLSGEWEAVRQALMHFSELEIQGGVILIKGKVEAFALGELLNDETAVVHVEKANALIPGLYALINQQFIEHCWRSVSYINREQDLGEPGLRQAKLSYSPHHFTEKFSIGLIP